MSHKWTESYKKFADLDSDDEGEGGKATKAVATRFDLGNGAAIVPTDTFNFLVGVFTQGDSRKPRPRQPRVVIHWVHGFDATAPSMMLTAPPPSPRSTRSSSPSRVGRGCFRRPPTRSGRSRARASAAGPPPSVLRMRHRARPRAWPRARW